MNTEIKQSFSKLARKFSDFYSQGGMSLELKYFNSKPSKTDLIELFKEQGYLEEGIRGLIYLEVSNESAIRNLESFFLDANEVFNKEAILPFIKLFKKVASNNAILIQDSSDDWCRSLTFLVYYKNQYFLYDFFWQFD
jgi:hypothetical protein